jgi:RNA polymerase sigma-54 factor
MVLVRSDVPAQSLQQSVQLTQDFAQRQLLSPLAIQLLSTLVLSQADMDAFVAARMAANPLLVAGPPRRCRWCASVLRIGRCPRCAGPVVLDRESVAVVDEREELRLQARLLVRPALASVVDLVVSQLDTRGLLPGPAPRSASSSWTSADWAEAVRAVRAAGPPGVAAPDVHACLLAQAQWHASRGGPALLVPVVAGYLREVAGGEHDGIAAALDAARGEVDAAVAFLRARLRPSALATEAGPVQAGMPPDVIVQRRGDDLDVTVLGAADLGLGVDPELGALAGAGTAEPWVAERLVDARALLDIVDRRATALRRVATAVVHAQREYVLQGPSAHRPLTRATVARGLGLSPSTVSRAVQGTVVALPGGRVQPLSAFFGPAVAAVECLARMLASDDPPRSDADAAARLRLAGHDMARRTVAKYRHQLRAAAGGRKPPSG